MEKLTIDEEYELRAQTAQFLYELVEDLKGSISFFIDKCNFAFRNQLSDQMVFYHLLEVINKEVANIIHQCEPAQKMVSTSILPICEWTDTDALEESLQRVILLFWKVASLRESPHFTRYCSLTDKMLTALFQFRRCNIFPAEEIESVFTSSLNRYKEEHDAALRYYIEDCCSPEEDKVALRREYKGQVAVDSWNINGRDILKTIKDIALKGAKEKDLIPLFEYIAKYDLLSAMEKDPSRNAQTVIKADTYIENIEKVDNIGQ